MASHRTLHPLVRWMRKASKECTPESDGRVLAWIVEAVGNDSPPYREEVCCRRPQPGTILIAYPPFLLLGRYPHGSHFQPCIAWTDPSHGRIKIATSSGLVLSKHGFVRPRQLEGGPVIGSRDF